VAEWRAGQADSRRARPAGKLGLLALLVQECK
jgi:hypothetical protein